MQIKIYSYIFITGSEYKEFQVSAMADLVKFQQFTTPAANWNPTSEQFDGVVVVDAFSDAPSVSVSPGV